MAHLTVLLVLAGGWAPAAARAEGPAWWNASWQYRREIDVGEQKPTGLAGDDIAVVTMPTGGQVKSDGSDVRVVSARGVTTPCRALMVGPGDLVRVALAIRPGETKYHVYFGNANPPKSSEKLDIRRGVLLETWKYEGGRIRTLEQARDVLSAGSKTFVGADFLDRIFLGHNPFGPQEDVARIFTGWLICPADGEYMFVTSSTNASFLLIDDKLVVDNGGWHGPQRDIRKNGRITLKAGLHKLTMYHVSGGGDPIAVAAWRPPGRDRVEVIPREAFAPVAAGKPGVMRRCGHDVGIDFLYEHPGEAFMANRYYQRYAFRALAAGNLGRNVQWQWDFGDGQKAEGEKVEHVYLTDGEHAVTLTVRTGLGVFKQTNRLYVSRPWDRVTQAEQESVRSYA
ncbi:MAG TPA: PKD domain-containing protein, partial [Phycisphaerae bacterium]|nr:PKD domain-containing protein [Phycisphaerae bacterium]